MFDSIFKSKWIPISLQILTLFVFILIITFGWSISTNDQQLLLTLRNTNFANLIIWCFWWPAIILLSILFGRLWCTVCPMELIASLLSRIGLKLKVPKSLRSGWAITLLYAIVLVIGIHTFAIHRVPHRMALYMISLFGVTIIVSLIFQKRAFCSYFCPVGTLLGLYSTNAAMEWRVKDRKVCDACKEKPCINKKRNFAWYGRACQSNLFPGSLSNNVDCILCTQCIKACPNNNVTFRFRWPFKDLFKGLKLNLSQLGFILIVFGFAFYEVVTEWGTSKNFLLEPFTRINELLHISSPWDGTVKALLLFIVLPVIMFLIISFLQSLISKGKAGFATLKYYLVAFIPLIASVHFAKSVVKSVSRFQFVPSALKDQEGIETAHALITGTIHIGGQWQTTLNYMAQGFSIFVMMVGLVVTLNLLVRIADRENERFPVFYYMLSIVYFTCTAGALAGKMFG